MSSVHFHLLFNHAAILGVIFSLLILLAGIVMKKDLLKKTAMVGFIISAISGAIVMNTGEGAEDAVENIPGITEAVIEAHEESAEFSIWTVAALGLLSVAGLFLSARSGSVKGGVSTLLLLTALLAAGSISYTGWLGGKIRHTELGGGAAATSPAGESGEDDD